MTTSTRFLYPVAAALIAGLAACAPDDGATRPDRDRSADTGDAADDDGTDLDPTAAEELEESGDAACTADDLIWSATVEDRDGNAVSRLFEGDALTLVGRVENPCDQTIELDTDRRCLIAAFEVVARDTGDGDYAELDCPLYGARVILHAGDAETAAMTWTDVPAGTYDLAVHFGLERRVATTSVEVE